MARPDDNRLLPPRAARRRRTLNRRMRRVLLGAGIALGLWLLVVTVMLIQARRSVDAAVDRLQDAREELSPGDLVRGEARQELRDAHDEFERAHDLASSFVVGPLEVVPLLGQQIRSVDAQTSAALQVVAVGEEAVEAAERRFRTRPGAGAERVELMRAVSHIADRAERRLRAVDLGPDFLLVGPIGDARQEFTDRLREIRESLAASQAVAAGFADFLQGPGRYLVLAANNAEMRAGSGMLLSAGVLTVDGGQLELGDMRPTGDLIVPTGAVPVDGDFAARWGWLDPTHDFRNLATTPRFEVTAPLAAEMWRVVTGETVDGVLALDPLTLQALLAAEGPISLEDGTSLDARTILDYVFVDQYREAPELGTDQQARRDRLGAIARAAVDAFEEREWKPPALVDELSPAGQGRHALAWSRDPVEQRAWQEAGIAGTLDAESLLVSLMNTGGNKLDQYVLIDARLSSEVRGDEREVALRLRIENKTPLGPPAYVVGPYPGLGVNEGDYLGILAVNVPGLARGSHIDDAPSLVAAGGDGPTRVVATTVRVNRGSTAEYTVRFTVPAGAGGLRVEPSAREPGLFWRFGDDEWQDRAARHVEW